MTHDLLPLTAPPDSAMQTPAPFATAPADQLSRWRIAMFQQAAPRFAGVAATSGTGDPAADVNDARVAAAKSWMETAREVAPGFKIDVPGGFAK